MFPCRAPWRAESIRDEPQSTSWGIKKIVTKTEKSKQTAEESDESSDSDQTTQQPTSQPTLNIPRFLVVKSEEKDRKVSDLSPFAMEKCIQSIALHPKSIQRLKSGDLLLEVEKQSHVTNFLTTKILLDLKVKISLHNTLNTSKGVIRCQDLGPCTDDEILDNLKSEGVFHVRIIKVRRNGVLKRTNTYVLTINTPVLPKKIKTAYLSVNVEVYIPNPLRCYHCQVFGLHKDNCMKKPICGNRSGVKHCIDDRNCKETSKCAFCNGLHPVFSRNCQTWEKGKEMLSVKYKRSLTFYKAQKIVEVQLWAPANSYASITKGAGKHVECIDAQTQTDETYNVQLKTTASGGDPTPSPGQNADGGPPPPHQTNAGGKPRPAPKPPLTPLFKEGATASSSGQSKPTDQKNAPKLKIDTGRVSKGSDDPIKSLNVFDVLNEEGMEAETTPASPRKGQIARLPIT